MEPAMRGTPNGGGLSVYGRTFGYAHAAAPHEHPSFRREAAANVSGPMTSSRNSRGPISHGDCPRPEPMAIHELELDALAQTGEQRRPVAVKDRLHKELVLVDQSQIRQRQGERHATHQQASPGSCLSR
jgi:hypothetical protein